MPNEDIKKKLRKLCKEVADGKKEPEEIIKIFAENRESFFENSKPYTEDSLYDTVYPCLTCSCGSTRDSCEEDGLGKYSQFFVTFEGDIFRKIIYK